FNLSSQSMAHHRTTYAEIDLSAFRHNVQTIRSLVGDSVKVMAVIKADGYGHGAIPCARAALQAGADTLGVGILEEGIELRENGIQAPVLVLSGTFPEEIPDLLHHDLSTTLCTDAMAQAVSRQAAQSGVTARVHIKIDTGMGRLGLRPEEFVAFAKRIQGLKNLQIEGVATHFSSADEEDPEYTQLQLTRFRDVLGELKKEGITVPLVHCANSAALIRFPESWCDLVRPGIILYGALPSPGYRPFVDRLPQTREGRGFLPVMHWKTRILQLSTVPPRSALSYGQQFVTRRTSRIATLPIGYADGLHRRLSNRMQVLVRGTRVPQVGRICMDLTLIDVTDLPAVEVGDEVVLFGRQGEALLLPDELAQ
ncbi:MAG: alanine racemase, partial [Nitrospinaceae bacterium]|nr:alanine racemase [Nitrospinaceae bacterium]NIR57748.1 alanine racemase [Nitrospinaceae bacterium]NIT85092.1 alanine racemase [Nitrospinaceae bacterium]NIW08811.1 alanine racemase [Nitrospinaceae bacterium]NIX37405.1 alanine racemase [Nitrospinaceae bacterium]